MTRWLKVAGIVLLLAVAVATYSFVSDWLDGRSDRDARIIQLETSLDSLERKITAEEAQFREDEEKWKRQREADSTTIAALSVDVVEAEAEADRREAELREKLPIQFRAEFDELVAAHNRQVAAILARESEKDRIIARQDVRHAKVVADFERINADLHQQVALALEKSDEWEAKSKRAIWEKPIFTIPVTVATTVLLTNALTSK